MARIVTGSVADKVEPKVKLSTNDRSIPSIPRNEYMWTRTLHASKWTALDPDYSNSPDADGGYECSCKRKGDDGPKIAEEVLLVRR